ncbi:MAG: T9SS type A sorting domain-containing protein [Bacteroidetes bacterium SB0662_bin_6]|nr:T9SS type A sorting domain-containing protein [Bacteroidetes bacterium SB0668_bin_1]MYE04265.1 T9SS type A sorting domain-containing protein [Bacteroidetes bacterium SB0662_bin_6]
MKIVTPMFLVCLLVFAGVFSGARPAFAQFDEVCPRPAEFPALDPNAATAEKVENGEATLTEFVTDYFTYALQVSASPLAAGYFGCALTHEGPWNYGSTYIATMTPRGTLVLHGKDILLSGGVVDSTMLRIVSEAASASLGGSTFEFEGDDGYALSYFNPDGSAAFLTAGLDIQESHLVEDAVDPGDPPAVTARDVKDRETLKAFVNGALDYMRGLYETEGFDATLRVKRILRDTTGYWRYGPTYLFVIDLTGYTFFHGAFPEKYELRAPTNTLRDAVTGELILPQIIAAATNNEEGGFVEYHFDNPDDDTDSAEIPKVTFARQYEVTFTLPNGNPASLKAIIGAGIYEDAVAACPRPDGIPALNPNAATAEQVENGDATLTQFVTGLLTYGAQIRGSRRSFGYIGCLATHEGPWNFGSTYLVTMTSAGRLVLHGQDVLLTGGLLDSPVFGSIAAAASASPIGSAFEFEGDDGYAFPSMQPDGSQGIATIGLDIRESHLVEETLDPGAAPAVTARDVTDRESLQAFVNGAADYLEELYAAGGLDAILKVKKILRDMTGYWRHGPTYLFIMDRNGYTLFHGAFPEKYELQAPTETLRDAVTDELILPKIIAAATSDEEGGFVEYHFDNPDDDTDSAEIPKVTFALEREFIYVFPDSTERPFDLIIGAGIYEDDVTSVEPVDGEIPAAFALEQNYPNPFNPSTMIEFSLKRAQAVTLTVYDVLGRKVRVLTDGVQPAGRYSVSFHGAGLAGGTYLYVLRTEQHVSVKKMTLLK